MSGLIRLRESVVRELVRGDRMRRCKSTLSIGDDYGDNSATLRCQRKGKHKTHCERYETIDHKVVVVSWKRRRGFYFTIARVCRHNNSCFKDEPVWSEVEWEKNVVDRTIRDCDDDLGGWKEAGCRGPPEDIGDGEKTRRYQTHEEVYATVVW